MSSSHTDQREPGRATISRRRVIAASGHLAVASVAAAAIMPNLAGQAHADHHGAMMSDNEKVVRAFIAAWSNLNAEELATYFTEDGTYHNMMLDPVSGQENLIAFIGGFLSNWSETQWDVINIVSNGDLVVAERLDRTWIGDQRVELPCVGMFEMENGKIKVWRDYFDLATYTGAFAG
jgi:limonene-1,2-epoxide hydrolase